MRTGGFILAKSKRMNLMQSEKQQEQAARQAMMILS